ncbi:MAG: WG repeat-containing protein, partial [Desulfovibrionaceae bacterium]
MESTWPLGTVVLAGLIVLAALGAILVQSMRDERAAQRKKANGGDRFEDPAEAPGPPRPSPSPGFRKSKASASADEVDRDPGAAATVPAHDPSALPWLATDSDDDNGQAEPLTPAPFEQDELYGFRDATGQTVVPPIYEYADEFSEGLAAVALDGRFGFIDPAGEVVVPLKYEDARAFSEGLAAVMQEGLFGYLAKTGAMVISPAFPDARGFSEGLAAAADESGLYGYIDKSGHWSAYPRYDFAG